MEGEAYFVWSGFEIVCTVLYSTVLELVHYHILYCTQFRRTFLRLYWR